jgi:hypothetical protein
MVTKSQRRLRRTIKILENSVELSSKETYAKSLEKNYKKKAKKDYGIGEYPVESLTNAKGFKQKEKSKDNI